MVLVRHGQHQLALGDLDAAGNAAGQALDLDPDSAAAHTLMALVADRRDEPDTAGEHYRRAVELAPMQGGMLNNYGTWLCQNGQPAESIEWFRRALSAPGYATPARAAANAGSCAQRAGDTELARRFLEAALEMDPRNPVALYALASLEFHGGDAFHARAFSQRRLAAAPATADALRLASQIEEKLGDKEAAARYVQRLRAEFPDASGSGIGEDGTR
jgi:type IV pilus assembly protein PilF